MKRITVKNSIAFKIIFFSTLLAAIFLGASFGYTIIKIKFQLQEKEVEIFTTRVEAGRRSVEVALEGAVLALEGISGTPPFQGMIRARKGDGFDEQGSSTLAQWEDRLSEIFIAEMQNNKLYHQLRYIDNQGNEIIRVNYNDGSPYRTREADLQNKNNRPYLQNSQNLSFGEFYISEVSLNREGPQSSLSKPYTPVIRYVIPVFDVVTGDRQGSFVANLDFNVLIDRADFEFSQDTDLMVVDSDGYYLYHADQEKLWGSPADLDTGENVFLDFPEFAENYQGDEKNTYVLEKNLFAYAKVFPRPNDQTYTLIVLERVTKKELLAPARGMTRSAALIGLTTFVLLFIFFFFAIRRLLAPLHELAYAAQKIGAGDFSYRVKRITNDEIGDLARTINLMTDNLKELYEGLEVKVKEKTQALEDNISELEDAKKATLNLLQSIEEEKVKFQAAFDSSAIGIALVSKKGEWLEVNDALPKILGYTKEEFLNMTFQDITYHEDLDEDLTLLQEVIEGKRDTYQIEKRYIHKNGHLVWVLLNVAGVRDTSGALKYFISQILNISKQKQIDKAKTEFVSLASHQLRTPLTTVRWYVELLLSEEANNLTAEQKDQLEEIATGNNRMINLVNALLNVSRIELGTFAVDVEEVSLKDILADVLKDLSPMILEKQHELRQHLDQAPKQYLADPKLLTIVFQNLLSNAIKYTPRQGVIDVDIHSDNDKLLISIRDTGYGIPKDQQNKIFTKLFRADNVKEQDTQGTGLGLYIVKAIVEESDGRIWFESEENKGTTFHVALPLSGMKKKEGSRPLEG